MDRIRKKLLELVNSESVENISNTPDWILGEFLGSCLDALNKAIKDRDMWYGSIPKTKGGQE